MNSLFPVLAAVEDLDAPTYESLHLGRATDEDADVAPQSQDKDIVKSFAVSSSMRSMARLLRSQRKCFSIFRGFGWHFLWNILKGMVLLLTFRLPSLLGFLAQVILSLAFIQLHTLWVHTIITKPSSTPFWRRLVPARKIMKAVALPMAILLIAEATTRHVLLYTYKSKDMKWENFFPMGADPGNAVIFWLVLATLTAILIIPAHLLLVRVEASLLPADERTIVPLDPAISGSQYDCGYLPLTKAWTSLSRTSRSNLIFLYVKLFLLTFAIVAVVGFVDFMWYILMAMQYWRF